ncbi:MAG: endonuclease, partial [Microvirga sp.]|nr:endonuclease [Microvirga sp.]
HQLHTPDKGSKEIAELSALLNRLAHRRGVLRTDKFRNANSVYMKLMNFRRLDPEFRAAGKVGLTRGAGGERDVWDAYAHDLPALDEAASAIRLAVVEASVSLSDEALAGEYEAEEWGVRLSVHLRRERDPAVVRLKKEAVLAKEGVLKCEVCDFDFATHYGVRGAGFIETHHRRPVSELKRGETTKADDLALVCANCHRMLHRGPRLLSIEELRSQLRPSQL